MINFDGAGKVHPAKTIAKYPPRQGPKNERVHLTGEQKRKVFYTIPVEKERKVVLQQINRFIPCFHSLPFVWKVLGADCVALLSLEALRCEGRTVGLKLSDFCVRTDSHRKDPYPVEKVCFGNSTKGIPVETAFQMNRGIGNYLKVEIPLDPNYLDENNLWLKKTMLDKDFDLYYAEVGEDMSCWSSYNKPKKETTWYVNWANLHAHK